MKTHTDGIQSEQHLLPGWCCIWGLIVLLYTALAAVFIWSGIQGLDQGTSGSGLALAVGVALAGIALIHFGFWYDFAIRREFSRRLWWRGTVLLLGGTLVQLLLYLSALVILFLILALLWSRRSVQEAIDSP